MFLSGFYQFLSWLCSGFCFIFWSFLPSMHVLLVMLGSMYLCLLYIWCVYPYLGWPVTPRMWLQSWRVINEGDKLLHAFPYIRKMAMMMDGCSCITETCSSQKSVPWQGGLWVAADVVCRLRVHVSIPIWAGHFQFFSSCIYMCLICCHYAPVILTLIAAMGSRIQNVITIMAGDKRAW